MMKVNFQPVKKFVVETAPGKVKQAAQYLNNEAIKPAYEHGIKQPANAVRDKAVSLYEQGAPMLVHLMPGPKTQKVLKPVGIVAGSGGVVYTAVDTTRGVN